MGIVGAGLQSGRRQLVRRLVVARAAARRYPELCKLGRGDGVRHRMRLIGSGLLSGGVRLMLRLLMVRTAAGRHTMLGML